jgi:hypothetical protein
MNVNTVVKDIASRFSLTEHQLIEQGLKAFLQDQFRLSDAELRTIFARHHVQSLEEFNQLLADHPDEESDLLPDFQRADFLTSRIKEISQWIQQLNGGG